MLLGGPAFAQPPTAAEAAPAICGPRCVEFLLHWYGHPTDVTDLIDELQGGRPYQMVSLQQMAEVLTKRGVHTKAVRLGWGATVDWPHPVVRHSTRADGAGHFTVLVPPRGEFGRLVWTGDAGYQRELTAKDGEASGVLLLTAPDPIGDVRPAVQRGVWPLVAGAGGAGAGRPVRSSDPGPPPTGGDGRGPPYGGGDMRRASLMTALGVGVLTVAFVTPSARPLAEAPDSAAVTGGAGPGGGGGTPTTICSVNADYPCPLVLRNDGCDQVECSDDMCPGNATGYVLTDNTYKGLQAATAGQSGQSEVKTLDTKVVCQYWGPCARVGQVGTEACSPPIRGGKSYCRGGLNLDSYNKYEVGQSQVGGATCKGE